jgi:hypothetical protein
MHVRTILGALCLAACTRSAPPHADSTAGGAAPNVVPESTGTPAATLDRTIERITQGAPDSAVRVVAGPPDSVSASTFSEMLGDTVQTWYYRDLVVELVDHRVDGVSCRRDACATGKGVRVGDPIDAVTRAYGAGERTRGDAGESIVYRDANNCGMAFEVAGERVRAIQVFCDHS